MVDNYYSSYSTKNEIICEFGVSLFNSISHLCLREYLSFSFACLRWNLSFWVPIEMVIQINSSRYVVNQPFPHGLTWMIVRVPLPCRYNNKGVPLTDLLWPFFFGATQDFGKMSLGLGNRPNTPGIVIWGFHRIFPMNLDVVLYRPQWNIFSKCWRFGLIVHLST